MALGFSKLKSLAALGGAPTPIAIDLGSQSIKLLQLSGTEQPNLISAVTVAVPEALQSDAGKRLQFQLEAIGPALKQGGFRGKRVVCSLPSSHTFCKHLQVQPAEGVTIDQLVAGEVSTQLTCDPSALVSRSLLVDGAHTATGGKSEVIALTVARSLVAKLMDTIKAQRCQLVGLQPECLAVLHGFGAGASGKASADAASVFLDIGAGSTKVYIGHGSTVVFAKTIQLGGRFLDQTIARQANCTLTEARAMRWGMKVLTRGARAQRAPSIATPEGTTNGFSAALEAVMKLERMQNETAGQPAGGVAVATAAPAPAPPADEHHGLDLSEPLDTLTDEVNLCLRYYEAMFPSRRVQRAIFIGGESKHLGLCQHIARTLRMPAHVADPLARVGRGGGEKTFGIDLREPQPAWAVALGLCLAPTDL